MTSKKVKKTRADELLVKNDICEDLTTAKKLIMTGKVRIGADRVIKNGAELVPVNTIFNVEQTCPYVSRGAFKLKPMLEKHLSDLTGKNGFDVGASTGGFTDLMLQSGAVKVYTVDSGKGQLHGKLRNDPRVICHEQTNARSLAADFLPEQIDLITMDVSFISVTKILPAVNQFLCSGGLAFILVKPQFEAARNEVEKGGVVRDEGIRQKCVDKVNGFAQRELSWELVETAPCPIKGPKGNQEFMCVFRKS